MSARYQSPLAGFQPHQPAVSLNWRTEPDYLPPGWSLAYDAKTAHYAPTDAAGVPFGAFRYSLDAIDKARSVQRQREDGPDDAFPFSFSELI